MTLKIVVPCLHCCDPRTGSLQVKCPVRLIHALQDEEVSFQFSVRLLESCASTDAALVSLSI